MIPTRKIDLFNVSPPNLEILFYNVLAHMKETW